MSFNELLLYGHKQKIIPVRPQRVVVLKSIEIAVQGDAFHGKQFCTISGLIYYLLHKLGGIYAQYLEHIKFVAVTILTACEFMSHRLIIGGWVFAEI